MPADPPPDASPPIGDPPGDPLASRRPWVPPADGLGVPAAGPFRQRWLVEPSRLDSVRARTDAPWFAVASVCVGAFMGQLDASIVTQAFPALQHAFHAPLAAVTWVGLSYLLVLVGTVTAVGRFADMLGRKLVYVYGFALFLVASALCGLAPSLGALDAFRVLQAFGAAMLQANSVAIIYLAVPRRNLGRSLGFQGAAQALGLALGPAIGGLLLAAGGWRLIFFVNVPVGVLGLVAGWLCIPRSRHLQPWTGWARVDWTGIALLLAGLAGLLLGLSLGSTAGWTSPEVLVLFVAGAAAGGAFVAWERRAAAPVLELSLFRRQGFGAGIGSGMLVYLVLFGLLTVVPFLLERGLGIAVGLAGLLLMVMPAAIGLTAPFAGRLADRLGARHLTVAGTALVVVGLVILAETATTLGGVVVGLAVVGAGTGLFSAPNNSVVMATATEEQSGLVSGVLNMTRGVGTALGLALTGLVFDMAGGATPSAAHSGQVSDAFTEACWFLAAVAGVAVVLALLRRRTPGGARVAEPGGAAPAPAGVSSADGPG